MCVGIPMQVRRSDGKRALCEGRGQRGWVDMLLVGEQPAGTWVLAFLGAAREVLSEQRAREVDAALDALEAVLRGEPVDVDAFFPDLAQREPQLPAHLRPADAGTLARADTLSPDLLPPGGKGSIELPVAMRRAEQTDPMEITAHD